MSATVDELMTNIIETHTMNLSNIFSLNGSDVAKAIVLAILTPVAGYVVGILQTGSLTIDWHQVLTLAISGFAGYLAKNFLSDSNGKVLGAIG